MTRDETANRDEPAEGGRETPAPPTARPVRTGHPLGPLVSLVPLDTRIGGRLYAAAVLAGVIAVFVVAARLHPQGRGHGTHRQLGLPPCGFVVMTGLPCPTCGMTTSFAYTVRGEVWPAIRAQVAGFLLAVVTLVAGLASGFALVTGRRPALNWYRINPMHVMWGACGLFVAAWAVKILFFLLETGSAGRIRE